jgi:hypothetical protein
VRQLPWMVVTGYLGREVDLAWSGNGDTGAIVGTSLGIAGIAQIGQTVEHGVRLGSRQLRVPRLSVSVLKRPAVLAVGGLAVLLGAAGQMGNGTMPRGKERQEGSVRLRRNGPRLTGRGR